MVGGDTLTCGVCRKEFALADIVKFIQHKVLTCNKENYNADKKKVAENGQTEAELSTSETGASSSTAASGSLTATTTLTTSMSSNTSDLGKYWANRWFESWSCRSRAVGESKIREIQKINDHIKQKFIVAWHDQVKQKFIVAWHDHLFSVAWHDHVKQQKKWI